MNQQNIKKKSVTSAVDEITKVQYNCQQNNQLQQQQKIGQQTHITIHQIYQDSNSINSLLNTISCEQSKKNIQSFTSWLTNNKIKIIEKGQSIQEKTEYRWLWLFSELPIPYFQYYNPKIKQTLLVRGCIDAIFLVEKEEEISKITGKEKEKKQDNLKLKRGDWILTEWKCVLTMGCSGKIINQSQIKQGTNMDKANVQLSMYKHGLQQYFPHKTIHKLVLHFQAKNIKQHWIID